VGQQIVDQRCGYFVARDPGHPLLDDEHTIFDLINHEVPRYARSSRPEVFHQGSSLLQLVQRVSTSRPFPFRDNPAAVVVNSVGRADHTTGQRAAWLVTRAPSPMELRKRLVKRHATRCCHGGVDNDGAY
jgi:hypothetical protein